MKRTNLVTQLLPLQFKELLAVLLLLLLAVVLHLLLVLLQPETGSDAREAAATALEAEETAREVWVGDEGGVEFFVELLGVQ